jgi:2-dehydro-3-deoxyphosphooctonate aldolase (KDO 8-P synthase)
MAGTGKIFLEQYGITIGNDRPFTLIAGPCVLEDNGTYLVVAEKLSALTRELGIPYIFKASYDKANRSSIHSFRGFGIERGLDALAQVRELFKVPVLTDVHSPEEATAAGKVVDVLQVPAFLCRQTDIIAAVAATGKPANIKKGQFLSPPEVGNIIAKFAEGGGKDLIITERGTTFGYNNLVVDMRGFAQIKAMGVPVCFDATHSVQLPGGGGTKSGGQREFVMPLSRSALAQGIAALFWEVHPKPEDALSDGPNMIPLADMPALLRELKALDGFVKGR